MSTRMDVLDVRLVLCCVENRVIFSEPYHIFGHFALDELALVYVTRCCDAGSSTFHNLTVKGASVPALYEGYAGNFVPAHARSDANEATPRGPEVSCLSS